MFRSEAVVHRDDDDWQAVGQGAGQYVMGIQVAGDKSAAVHKNDDRKWRVSLTRRCIQAHWDLPGWIVGRDV
jgi:hypothetical protein